MITEPDVALTDYGLTVECAILAHLLLKHGDAGNPLKPWFILFFASVGLAALAGGTVHGFFLDSTSLGAAILWPASLIAIGLTALSGWAIGARLMFSPAIARRIAQRVGIGLHPAYFNHNALYHLIQAAALWMIFRSARWLSGKP